MVALARLPVVTRYTPPHRGAVDAQAQVWQNPLPNLLQSTANSTVFRLPLTFRREPVNPYVAIAAETGVWENPLMLLQKSKDLFFTTAGRGATYDWQNPRGYPFPMDGRTFNNSMQLMLLGKDQFFDAPGLGPNYDWPNPGRYTPGIDLKSAFNNLLQTGLAPVPPISLVDHPNPTLARDRWGVSARSLNETWTNARPLTPTSPTIIPPPLVTKIEPLSRIIAINAQTLVWENRLPIQTPVQEPNSLLDWPNPRGYAFPLENRGFTGAIDIQLIGLDKFFGAPGQVAPTTDWPNPHGYGFPIAMRTGDVQNLLGTILLPTSATNPFFLLLCSNPNPPPPPWSAVRSQSDIQFASLANPPTTTVPFVVNDQPNPRGYTPAIDLKTWLDPLKLNLLSQDKFYSGAGCGPDFDWPNPRGYPFPAENRTFIDHQKLGLTGNIFTVGGPAYDYPNPRGYAYPTILRTFTDTNKFTYGTAIFTVAGPSYDYPNPRGYPFPVENRGFVDPIDLCLLGKDLFFGPAGMGPDYDYPNPRGYTYPSDLRTLVQAGFTTPPPTIPPPPGVRFDFPNPRGYPFPISLRTLGVRSGQVGWIKVQHGKVSLWVEVNPAATMPFEIED